MPIACEIRYIKIAKKMKRILKVKSWINKKVFLYQNTSTGWQLSIRVSTRKEDQLYFLSILTSFMDGHSSFFIIFLFLTKVEWSTHVFPEGKENVIIFEINIFSRNSKVSLIIKIPYVEIILAFKPKGIYNTSCAACLTSRGRR